MGRKRTRTTRKWRKSADTAGEAMAAIRERHSKSQIKETPNDQLFMIDTGSTAQKPETKKAKRKGLAPTRNTRSKKKKKLTERVGSEDAVFNLWDGPNKDNKDVSQAHGWDIERKQSRNQANNRRSRRRDAKIVRNAPRIRKVSVPTAGLSYNPSKDAHEDAISEAAAKEYARVERIEKDKIPEPTNAIAVNDYTDDEEGEGEDEGQAEETQVCTAKKALVHRSLKKTRAQRNRAKRGKLQDLQSKKKKALAQSQHQIFRSATINKELDASKAAESERRSVRHKLRQEALDQPLNRTVRVGGKKRLLEPCPAVALSEDLKGSLLKMKAQGNVLTDRWHSMLERNKFELGDKERIVKMKKDQRRAHKAYGKAHWGPAALIRDAEKRA